MPRVMIIGANRGIGRALLDGYLAMGWECIATSRKEQMPEDNVTWIKLDVRDSNNHIPITGKLDLLICNAGVFLDRGDKIGSGFEAKLWEDTFATNVTGTYLAIETQLEALKAAKKVSGKTKLIGVTVLTSLDDKSLKEIGFNKDINKLVFHQAKLAHKAKLDGIVCSAHEVRTVKKVFKKEIITPGIRFNSQTNDQKRILTPKEAFKNGSDWLVIGRPITKGNIKKNIKKLIDHLNQ